MQSRMHSNMHNLSSLLERHGAPVASAQIDTNGHRFGRRHDRGALRASAGLNWPPEICQNLTEVNAIDLATTSLSAQQQRGLKCSRRSLLADYGPDDALGRALRTRFGSPRHISTCTLVRCQGDLPLMRGGDSRLQYCITVKLQILSPVSDSEQIPRKCSRRRQRCAHARCKCPRPRCRCEFSSESCLLCHR